jgi:signal transduction histidine kinase
MQPEESHAKQLEALASHLAERREALLAAWLETVSADPELHRTPFISLAHLRDLMPEVLRYFEQRLHSIGAAAAALDLCEEKRIVDHGLHRWKQGYSLYELVVEWHHMQLIVLAELEDYGRANPGLHPDVLPAVRRLWTEVCGRGIGESVAQYHALQQAEAAGRLQDLEEAVEALQAVSRRRAESWQEAAHDLRGNIGIVTTLASLLADEEVPEELRQRASGRLQSSVSTLHQLLEDLMSLARLEAGREQRKIEPFDAAALMRELAGDLQPMARDRGLYLVAEGPTHLSVEGDPAKVQRIVQNLVLNALRYTSEGGVKVSWGETRERDIERWLIRIEDTGPGLHAPPGSPISHHLKEATDRAREIERQVKDPGFVEPVPGPEGATPPRTTRQQPGEGIGLSIVKRLCELLEASLAVATQPGQGTTFQVGLPRRYDGRSGE